MKCIYIYTYSYSSQNECFTILKRIHLTAEELCTTGDDIGTGQHGEFTILVASN